MKDRISGALFSLNGLSLMVAALGVVSAFVTMFVDISSTISVKWLLATVWVAASLGVVLLKVIYDLQHEKRSSPPFEVPIKYLDEKQIYLIRRNENFNYNIVVGCYEQQDDVDTLVGIGVVEVVQEKFMQIKVIGSFMEGFTPSTSKDALQRVQVRPVVPLSALTNTLTVNA